MSKRYIIIAIIIIVVISIITAIISISIILFARLAVVHANTGIVFNQQDQPHSEHK